MQKEEYQSKLWDYPKAKEAGIKPFSWSLYNESQTREKTLFMHLLAELCATLENEREAREIFCMAMKVYLGMSSRRLTSDLRLCHDLGYIGRTPHFNTVLNYFNRKSLQRVLKYLIGLSAVPLAVIERQFAVDASGIGAHQYEVWSSVRSKHKEHRKYRKVHCIYGVLSNVIPVCKVTKGNTADSPQFEELLRKAATNFVIEEVSADLAYGSRANLQLSSELGCIPYIPFKRNARGNAKGSSMWHTIYRYFKDHPEKYLKHYHKRSNAETGFYMIKTKFGEFVMTKNEIAQENEIYVKFLCHNICVLIQEMFLQGIEIDFKKSAKMYVAQL